MCFTAGDGLMDGWINFPSGVNKVIRAEGTFKYHQNTRANIEKALYIYNMKKNQYKAVYNNMLTVK